MKLLKLSLGVICLSLLMSAYADNPCGYECTQKIIDAAIEISPGPQGPNGDPGATGSKGVKGEPGNGYGCTGSKLSECKVIVTSKKYSGNLTAYESDGTTLDSFVNTACSGAAAGLDKANCICSVEGARVSTGRWRAWLSTSSMHAKNNVNYNSGATYIRPDGTVIANPGGGIVGASIQSAVTTNTSVYSVYTGTAAWGTASGAACSDWSTNSSSVNGSTGDGGTTTGGRWTDDNHNTCDVVHPIYCFESPSAAEVIPG